MVFNQDTMFAWLSSAKQTLNTPHMLIFNTNVTNMQQKLIQVHNHTSNLLIINMVTVKMLSAFRLLFKNMGY